MIHFEIRPHQVRTGADMVAVMRDGEFVGGLYATPAGVKFVSAYEGIVRTNVSRATSLRRSGPLGQTLREIDIEIGEGRLS